MKNTVLQGGAGLLVLVVLGATGFWLRDQFSVNPLQTALEYEYPGFAAADSTGNTYLIDRSLKRIVKTTPGGDLAWVINGGSREPGAFFFADELTVGTDGSVYVLNRVPDAPGFYTVLTQVLKFRPDGSFDRVLAAKAYGPESRVPTLVQRGQWHSLQAVGDDVVWFDSTAQGLALWSGTVGGIRTQTAPGTAADLLIPSAGLLPDGQIVAVTKQGQIVRWAGDGTQTVLFDASARDSEATPWKLRTTLKGRIFFTDLTRRGVAELLPDGTAPLRFSTGQAVTYSLSAGLGEALGTTGDAGPRFLKTDGTEVPAPVAARFPLALYLLHWGLWLMVLLAVAVVLGLFRLVYVDVLGKSLPPFLKTVAAVVVLTAAVGWMVSAMILTNFSQRYSTEVLSKITQLVHLVPRLIDTDELAAITAPAQVGGPEYNSLRQQIIGAVYGDKNEDNQGLYFAIHRVWGNQGLTTLMYLNGDTTVHHPFAYLNDPEGPYQKALQGQTVAQYALDAWGSWMYSTGPIRAKDGTIVGVFEMGGDLYSFTQENNRLVGSLIVNILTVLVIFLLVLVELTFLQDQVRQRSLAVPTFRRVYLVRAVSGLFFVSASVSLMFLPLMMKGFYQPLWGLPENVVYALPVSVRLFFFGLGTVAGGNLTRRWGWRPVFLAGLAVSAAGLTAAALSVEMVLFLASSVAIGLGAGLGMIGLRALVNAEADEGSKATAYGHFYAGIIAGTNVGVIVGSALADLIGFANVFWLALMLTAGALVLVLKLFPRPAPPRVDADDLTISQAAVLFFRNPGVARFLGLIVLPVYVASMVLYFFLPVFAQARGVSNADIGRIFLLNGLVIVYAGPTLSRLFQSRLGPRRSLLVSSILWLVALVPFVILGDMTGLVATVVLMGLAEGTAAVAHNEHLMGLPVAVQVGGDRAAGFFEVAAKVGETLAPVLIGFAMLLGAQWGITLVAAFLALTLIVFRFTERRTAEVRP